MVTFLLSLLCIAAILFFALAARFCVLLSRALREEKARRLCIAEVAACREAWAALQTTEAESNHAFDMVMRHAGGGN